LGVGWGLGVGGWFSVGAIEKKKMYICIFYTFVVFICILQDRMKSKGQPQTPNLHFILGK